MKALRRLTVRAALPAPLAPLGEIVANLRWSWHPESLDLLESVDPELWSECNSDPTAMLGAVRTERLEILARDRKFLRRLSDISDDLIGKEIEQQAAMEGRQITMVISPKKK